MDLYDAHGVGDTTPEPVPLLTQAEMDRAVNDPSDPYHLSYAEQARVINRLIPVVPVEVAAALCATWKERTQ